MHGHLPNFGVTVVRHFFVLAGNLKDPSAIAAFL
jgi:hypothetical protein